MRKIFIALLMVGFTLSTAGVGFAYEKAIQALSNAMVEKVAKAGKKNVAVVDFTDLQGNVTELGRFLAEELSSDLSDGAVGFEIIDRNHLKSILTEHKLSLSGLVNPKTIKQLGQISGVDAIVTGTVTPFGDSIRVSGKVIATDTAKVIASAKGDIAKTKAIEALLAKGIDTGGDTASPTTASSSPVSTSAKERHNVEVENLLFELQGCGLSGQAVTCTLLVTSKDKDTAIQVGFETRIFDDAGNEFKVNRCKLGNREDNSDVYAQIISNTPTKLILNFGNIDSDPKQLSMLDIGIYRADIYKRFRAQLRNIPLSK